MPEAWTGELIGRMHNARITYDDLAAEMGVKKAYICMILNGRRKPINAEARMNEAFYRAKQRKESSA
jgi:cyanate lyase